MTTRARVGAVVFCALGSLAACSSSRGYVPAAAPSPTSGAVALSPSSPAFTATGASDAQSVTPVAAGSCAFTITGGGGQSAALSIGVTTTVGGS